MIDDKTKQQLSDIIDEIKVEIVDGVDLAIQKTIPNLGRRYKGSNDYIKIILDNGITFRKDNKSIQYIPSGTMDLYTLEQTYTSLPNDFNQSIQAVADRLYQNIHDKFKNRRSPKTVQPPPFVKPLVQPPPFIKP
jgi:hypothetical protein